MPMLTGVCSESCGIKEGGDMTLGASTFRFTVIPVFALDLFLVS